MRATNPSECTPVTDARLPTHSVGSRNNLTSVAIALLGAAGSAAGDTSSIPTGPPVPTGFIGTLAPSDYYVTDVDVDAQGRVYATDAFHNRVTIFAPDGAVLSELDYEGFEGPRYLAVDPGGRLYVSDYGRKIWVFESDGAFADEWSVDFVPRGIDVDPLGRILVAENTHDQVVAFDAAGHELFRIGEHGSDPGELDDVNDAKGAPDGSIYIVDRFNARIQVFAPDRQFAFLFGSAGSGPGEFNQPKGVALDSANNIFVSDRGNSRIQKFSPAGDFVLEWGEQGRGPGRFLEMEDLTVAPDDTVWVAGFHANDIQHFDNDGTFIEQWIGHVSGPGEFANARGAALSQGKLFVADSQNCRIQAFDPASGAFLYTFGQRGSGPATEFDYPEAIAVGADGDLYISDDDIIRRIKPDGTFVAKFDRPPGGQPQSPGLAIKDGILYQSDWGNNRVNKVDLTTGVLLDSWGEQGTGPGQFKKPFGIALDDHGVLYVADKENDRVQLFTLNGDYVSEWHVTGPRALAFDPTGQILYIGRANTIEAHALTGDLLYSWGGTGMGEGEMNGVHSIALAEGGTILYVSENTNGRVQRFVYPTLDGDDDGVVDLLDNCVTTANADQRDADGDGIGSMCDADFDNDCIVSFTDLGALKAAFLRDDSPNTDMNGDGYTNFVELGLLKKSFFQKPGPSDVPNVCADGRP